MRNSAPAPFKQELQDLNSQQDQTAAVVKGKKKKKKFGLFLSLFSRPPLSKRLLDRLLVDKKLQSFSNELKNENRSCKNSASRTSSQ